MNVRKARVIIGRDEYKKKKEELTSRVLEARVQLQAKVEVEGRARE